MCGVTGIFSYGAGAAPVDARELLRIRDSMAVRGPDAAGEWFGHDNRVGLGHRRLAIIDLSPEGVQPMGNADGSLVISFNGEIYNYRELRAELEQQGCRFRSQSDTEVILQLYEREGQAMLRRLRGMFAFVLWDGRRGGMLLARDPLGIKPLYYTDDGKTLRVASQVKALLAGGRVEGLPNPAGVVSFYLFGSVADPHTIIKGVAALPAGHSLWVDDEGVRAPVAYFSVRKTLIEGTGRADASPADVRNMLREALQDSIKAHLVADVPVGVFLSAGLDSTSITSLAVELHGRLKTVTLGFGEFRDTPDDEIPLAEQVAGIFGTEHMSMVVSRADFLADRERLLDAMDQPTIDGLNTYFISKAAAAAGLKVALSGLGGDELFAGYPSFRQIPMIVRTLGSLRRFRRPLGRPLRIVSSALIRHFTSPKYAGILEYGTSVEDAYLLRRALYMPWELTAVLDADIVREGWRELTPLTSLGESTAGLPTMHAGVVALEVDWYMRNQLLRDTDWAGMAHSVEIRTPLVDATLLARLAPLICGPRPPTKHDMAMATPVAAIPALLNRPKTGFSVPMRQWFTDEANSRRSEHGLRAWAKQVSGRYMSDLVKR